MVARCVGMIQPASSPLEMMNGWMRKAARNCLIVSTQIGVSPRAYICGTPLIAEAAAELRGQLEAANRRRATR